MQEYHLNYLEQLEAESIYIFREAVAELKNPVMLYSIGKDSSVLLHLAQKAFYPAKIPFPLLHIDTGYKFREMIEFRDYYIAKIGAQLIVHKNSEPEAVAMTPEEAHTDRYIFYKKTRPLLEAIKKYKFDGAFGGARREEEKSRAKERIFSVRNTENVWDPKNQRPELWHTYNTRLNEGETVRIFPLSNWTELDIWHYIKQEKIEVVPLYYAQKRKVIQRNGVYLRLDEFVQPKEGEEVTEIICRYRTLGCSPSTGTVPSTATTLDEIIDEVFEAKRSERQTRAIDHGSESAMEQKKKEGYF
ncbi:MAG TPA: sulfate adenylyltransferase subunit CysD [Patescibacteria group bacterium]|nr:sulfate adenylyltransferase subunit CysD [Patescibacteria group bacterium]